MSWPRVSKAPCSPISMPAPEPWASRRSAAVQAWSTSSISAPPQSLRCAAISLPSRSTPAFDRIQHRLRRAAPSLRALLDCLSRSAVRGRRATTTALLPASVRHADSLLTPDGIVIAEHSRKMPAGGMLRPAETLSRARAGRCGLKFLHQVASATMLAGLQVDFELSSRSVFMSQPNPSSVSPRTAVIRRPSQLSRPVCQALPALPQASSE